jgi:hypothetical protein
MNPGIWVAGVLLQGHIEVILRFAVVPGGIELASQIVEISPCLLTRAKCAKNKKSIGPIE